MRPVPQSDNPYQYEAEVTVTFHFTLTADDDMQAEELAKYEWQDNLYRGEIDTIWVEAIEDEEILDDMEDEEDLA